jgi:DNA-binding NarL/FixJ family response regulator
MSEFLLGKSTNGAEPLADARLSRSDTAQVRSQQPEAQIIAIIEPTVLVRESLVELIDEALPHLSARPATLTLQDLLRDASVALIIKRTDSGEPIDLAPLAVSSRAAPPVLVIVTNDDAREALRYFQAGYRGVFPSTEKAETLIAAIQVLLAGCYFCPSSFVCKCLLGSGPTGTRQSQTTI